MNAFLSRNTPGTGEDAKDYTEEDVKLVAAALRARGGVTWPAKGDDRG